MTRLLIACLIVAAMLLLSGCGVRGDLERPPPLWGHDGRALAADRPAEADAGQDPA